MTMKKTLMTSVLVLSGLLAVPVAALAAEGGASKDDAVAMVKKGVARIKSGGAETAYAEFNDKANQTYRDRDLYLVVYGLDGVVLSHGANAKMIGKNLIDLNGQEECLVLAGLQVHQSREQEDRTQVDVLRAFE